MKEVLILFSKQTIFNKSAFRVNISKDLHWLFLNECREVTDVIHAFLRAYCAQLFPTKYW